MSSTYLFNKLKKRRTNGYLYTNYLQRTHRLLNKTLNKIVLDNSANTLSLIKGGWSFYKYSDINQSVKTLCSFRIL